MARRNKLLGNWVIGQLGLTGDAAVVYANDLVTSFLESQSDSNTLQKVSKDLASKGFPQHNVAKKMDELYHFALRQIEAGK